MQWFTPMIGFPRVRDSALAAVATVLIEQVPGINWGNLTRAIRKGCGAEVVFEPINKAGAQALGLDELREASQVL